MAANLLSIGVSAIIILNIFLAIVRSRGRIAVGWTSGPTRGVDGATGWLAIERRFLTFPTRDTDRGRTSTYAPGAATFDRARWPRTSSGSKTRASE